MERLGFLERIKQVEDATNAYEQKNNKVNRATIVEGKLKPTTVNPSRAVATEERNPQMPSFSSPKISSTKPSDDFIEAILNKDNNKRQEILKERYTQPEVKFFDTIIEETKPKAKQIINENVNQSQILKEELIKIKSNIKSQIKEEVVKVLFKELFSENNLKELLREMVEEIVKEKSKEILVESLKRLKKS